MNALTLLIIGLLFVSCNSGLGNLGNGGSGSDLNLTSTPKANELDASDQKALLDAINAMRNNGFTCDGFPFRSNLRNLTWDNKLEQAALNHTNVMLIKNVDLSKISAKDAHNHLGDGTVANRATAVGYQHSSIGENLAFGQTSVDELMSVEKNVVSWPNSGSHCENIMTWNHTQMGAAKLSGGTYGTYWTLVLSNPK